MADIRINSLPTTATTSASDDYIAIDGAANGTRKLSVYSPTFGGNLTVSGVLSNGNVSGQSYAIGATTSGATRLDLISTAANGKDWYLNSYSDGNFYIGEVGGADRLTIAKSTGNATLAGNLTVSGGTATLNGSSESLLYLQIGGANKGAFDAYLTKINLINFGSTDGFDFYAGGSNPANKIGSFTSTGLTVSGTGQSSTAGYFSINSALAGSTYGRLIVGTTNAGLPAAFFTDGSSSSLLIDFPSGFVSRIRTNGASESLAFGIGSTEVARFYGSNLLIGTTIDNTLGKLQVAGSATLAGDLIISTNSVVNFTVHDAYLRSAGGKNIYLQPAGTTALTLASDQSATFAGTVTANGGLLKLSTTSLPNIQLYASGDSADQKYWDIQTGAGTGTDGAWRLRAINDARSAGINAIVVKRSGVSSVTINFPNLPTSSAGLSAGDIWNSGGTLKVV